MRICTCCNKKKKASDFNLKHSTNKKSGIVQYHFTSFCRECLNEKAKEYYNKNREKRKEYQRNYNRTSEVYQRNRPARRKIYSDLRNRRTKLARLRCSNKENRKAIKQIYSECRALNTHSECRYVVDHIIPLHHKEVCGLHVAWNLQIITEEANTLKSNTFISDW